MLLHILDIARILGVAATFYIGYSIGFAGDYDPIAQLHFMVPAVIVIIAGISGIEGLVLGDRAAAAKGYAADGNYQRQSSFALLSYAAVAVFVRVSGWGIRAELTIFFAFIFFLVFSGINHAASAVRDRNFKWQNINRPFITLALIAGMAYPVIEAMKRI
ncbi:MAG TPA: hypothetical protein PK307_01415 [Spirochaetota bacterium]|nr:hypothetical protein [Spirochaetota bacterium]HOD16144.1 hypothetical protein [Spirochaetota bacterium]HPG50005.1 hypothetical protein [Spirochaetota bacterium]HPN10869.1 hypothetical protein [Spirochaetota bacterium]HQL80831.1 hypothetical protein [Spirochaetota bacterium]